MSLAVYCPVVKRPWSNVPWSNETVVIGDPILFKLSHKGGRLRPPHRGVETFSNPGGGASSNGVCIICPLSTYTSATYTHPRRFFRPSYGPEK